MYIVRKVKISRYRVVGWLNMFEKIKNTLLSKLFSLMEEQRVKESNMQSWGKESSMQDWAKESNMQDWAKESNMQAWHYRKSRNGHIHCQM